MVHYVGSQNKWTFNPAVLTRVGSSASERRASQTEFLDLALPEITNRLGSLAVHKDHTLKKNDFVRIINDENRVKRLQRGHGEWADVMLDSLGRIGKKHSFYYKNYFRKNCRHLPRR